MRTSEKESEDRAGKTTKVISIPSRLACEILQGLEKRQIECEYVGVNPSGQIVMRLYYNFTTNTELFLLTLEDEIKESEKLLDFLVSLGTKVAESTLEELILKVFRAAKSPEVGFSFFK